MQPEVMIWKLQARQVNHALTEFGDKTALGRSGDPDGDIGDDAGRGGDLCGGGWPWGTLVERLVGVSQQLPVPLALPPVGAQLVQLTNTHGLDRMTRQPADWLLITIMIAEMAVFNVAGYLVEERRRWPVITASPPGTIF